MKHSGWWTKSLRSATVAGVFLACVVLTPASNRATAQEGQGKYLTEASAALIKLVNASNKQGYKLPDNAFSVGGGWLKQGANNWVGLFTVELQAGRQYRFLAAGKDC